MISTPNQIVANT